MTPAMILGATGRTEGREVEAEKEERAKHCPPEPVPEWD